MKSNITLNYRQNQNVLDMNSTIKSIYIGANKPDSQTFAKWIERTQHCREIVLENKRQHQEELEGMADTWAKPVIEEKRLAYDQYDREFAEFVREKILNDLENVIAAKEARYHKAMGAPSEDQLRLLSVLKMRQEIGEDLTSSDFAGVVGHVADNYHALKMLQNLADKSNVAFPRIYDDFHKDLETVRQAATMVLNSIDTDKKDLGYNNLLFWSKGSFGLEQSVFNKLDTLAYLTTTPEAVEQAAIERDLERNIKSVNTHGKASDMCSKVRLTGHESISAICDQFHVTRSDIKALNPSVELGNIYAGLELYIPSTRFSYDPGNPSRVQPSQVQLAKTPVFPDPVGPHGEEVGDDIVLDV